MCIRDRSGTTLTEARRTDDRDLALAGARDGPMGLAVPGGVPNRGPDALLPPGRRTRLGPTPSRRRRQGDLSGLPGAPAVPNACSLGARTVRGVGRHLGGRAQLDPGIGSAEGELSLSAPAANNGRCLLYTSDAADDLL